MIVMTTITSAGNGANTNVTNGESAYGVNAPIITALTAQATIQAMQAVTTTNGAVGILMGMDSTTAGAAGTATN